MSEKGRGGKSLRSPGGGLRGAEWIGRYGVKEGRRRVKGGGGGGIVKEAGLDAGLKAGRIAGGY